MKTTQLHFALPKISRSASSTPISRLDMSNRALIASIWSTSQGCPSPVACTRARLRTYFRSKVDSSPILGTQNSDTVNPKNLVTENLGSFWNARYPTSARIPAETALGENFPEMPRQAGDLTGKLQPNDKPSTSSPGCQIRLKKWSASPPWQAWSFGKDN